MILVPTYNSPGSVARLEASIREYGLPEKTSVSIVDTGAECGPRYTTGVWREAAEQRRADEYLLLHDSMEIVGPGYYERFREWMTEGVGAVALAGFSLHFDNPEQVSWISGWLGESPQTWKQPDRGIFGNCFFTTQRVLDDLAASGLLPPAPVCKNEDMACERAWAFAFAYKGYRVEYLIPDYGTLLAGSDGGTGIRKHFLHRQ